MENVREALEWDSIPNMLYGLKDVKEALKMCVSALKSEGWNFTKFGKNLQKGWKATSSTSASSPVRVWLVPM